MLRRWRPWVCAALCFWCAGARSAWAQGGPPYFTNDPATPGDRQWEINVGYIPMRGDDESTRRMPDLDINYGVGERIQLTAELAWLGMQTKPEPEKFGLGQSVYGVKWRFYENQEGFSVSLFPQASVNNPTDSVKRGIAQPGGSVTFPLQVSRQYGGLGISGEAGYSVVQQGPNAWLAGVVVGREKRISHKHHRTLELDGEFSMAGEQGGSVTQAVIDGGVRYQSTKSPFVVLGMIGRSVQPGPRAFTAYLGGQLLLGPD